MIDNDTRMKDCVISIAWTSEENILIKLMHPENFTIGRFSRGETFSEIEKTKNNVLKESPRKILL